MDYRRTSILLIFLLISFIGVSVFQYWQLDQTRRELDIITKNFNELSETVDILVEKAGEGQIILTTSYDLQFVRESEDRFDYIGPTSALFYAPGEASVLEISLLITELSDGVNVPLVIQEGNAVSINSATVCIEKDGYSLCHAPIIWEVNTTQAGTYTVFLPSKGWYTISISGKIEIIMPAGGFNHPLIGSLLLNGSWEVTPVNVKVTFRVSNEELRNLFAINENYVIP